MGPRSPHPGRPGEHPRGRRCSRPTRRSGSSPPSRERVRLGTMVSAATYRSPALLVKAVTTARRAVRRARLARDRRRLPRGGGALRWASPFPRPRRALRAPRGDAPRSRFRCGRATTRRSRAPTSGSSARSRARCRLSRPHPPILIGGMGERRPCRSSPATPTRATSSTSRTAAPRSRASSLCSPSTARDRPALRATIEKTVSTRLEPESRRRPSSQRCRALAELGIEHAVVITAGPWTDDALSSLAAATHVLQRTSGTPEGRRQPCVGCSPCRSTSTPAARASTGSRSSSRPMEARWWRARVRLVRRRRSSSRASRRARSAATCRGRPWAAVVAAAAAAAAAAGTAC